MAFIQKLRHVRKINLVGWSQGGPRAGGWTANHPDQVAKLILLAPAYNRATKSERPALPVPGAVFNTQSHDEFIANWDRQAPCPGQYDPARRGFGLVGDAEVRSGGRDMEPGRAARAHRLLRLGLDGRQGEGHDHARPDGQRRQRQAGQPGTGARLLCGYRQPDRKIFIDLGCSSHNAMWEKNHLLLFQASLEWLEKGTVNGQTNRHAEAGLLAFEEIDETDHDLPCVACAAAGGGHRPAAAAAAAARGPSKASRSKRARSKKPTTSRCSPNRRARPITPPSRSRSPPWWTICMSPGAWISCPTAACC